MTQSELHSFIQENAFGIYLFINEKILNESGVMHPDYFIKILKEFIDEHHNESYSLELLPFRLLETIAGKGIIAYTSLRSDTIDFTQLNKESKTYYNYIRFSMKNESNFLIELMQCKIGGMPIDSDIVKYSKALDMNTDSFLNFIQNEDKDHKYTDNKTFLKINSTFS